ncbi:unnamed protein product [Fusarium venenatum]|uniref:Uncharacterized protein n=1 Tax=Fusarium venenatum TaxID=56646 RepID=A0A2L2TCV4_9HYPO|nr:uncharacterized protein FVRRES_08889 [Fusarium venenatum]CEI68812.1 unnamed protein product [Fusarium venenatum]
MAAFVALLPHGFATKNALWKTYGMLTEQLKREDEAWKDKYQVKLSDISFTHACALPGKTPRPYHFARCAAF